MKKYYFALAIFLRALLIIPITSSPLWYDENFTLLMIRRPLGQMLLAATGDVHPPLYYLILWPLGQIQHAPDWIIRIPSLLFSIACLFIWWTLLERLSTNLLVKRSAWVLFAVSSSWLYYTGEGRMYAWLGLLVMVSVWCLVDRRWVALGIVSCLLLWSHNYGIFYVACLWIAGMILDIRSWKPLTLAIGYAGLLFLPWIGVLLSQMGTIQGGYWMFRLTWPLALYMFYQSNVLYGKLVVDIYGEMIFFSWLVFSLLWLLFNRRFFTRGVFVILLFSFGPFVMAVLGSVLWQPILLYRALVPCAPFVGLLLVLPLTRLLAPVKSLSLAFIFIMPFTLINTSRLYIPGYHLRGVDDAEMLKTLAIIETNWQPDDTVLHIGDGSLIDMLPYAKYPASHYKNDSCGVARGSLSPKTRQGLGIQVSSPDKLRGHIWLITEESPMTPACEVPFINQLTQDHQPIYCIVDNPLQKSCLYEFTFPH